MIPTLLEPQTDFSAGELLEGVRRKDGADIVAAGARRVRNLRITNEGGLTNKPGSRVQFKDPGKVNHARPVAGKLFRFTFSAGKFTARLSGSSTVHTAITGAPWTDAMMADLKWKVIGKQIYVVHQTMMPRVITYDATADTWTLATFAWALDIDGAVKQPFYRFGYPNVTMTPSARDGSITVTFSGDVLVAGHTGQIFEYGGKQIRIDSVTDARHANATVIETLLPTNDVTVDSVTGFVVGQVVESSLYGAKGVISSIDPGARHIRVVYSKAAPIDPGGSDRLIGPSANSKATSGVDAPAGALLAWTEPLFSPVRGYPGSVGYDQQRVIFCDFPSFPEAIVWLAVSRPDDGKVTADADGAIFEYVPTTCRVLNVIGGSDEFVLTDAGVYFIPISISQPLKPGGIEFRQISTDGCSAVQPAALTEGVVFTNAAGTRVMGIRATGTQTAPWEVQDLTQYHSHLVNAPVCLAVGEGDASVPERYVYAVNADGSLLVGRLEQAKWVGWVRWEGTGERTWVSAFGTEVLLSTHRDAGADGLTAAIDTVELLDFNLLADGAWSLPSMAGTPVPELAGATVEVVRGDQYLGEWTVDANGYVSGAPADEANVMVGFWQAGELVPFIPNSGAGQSAGQRLRRRRVKTIAATVQDTQAFVLAGRVIAAWRAGEDQTGPAPLRSGTHLQRPLGRDFDPQPALTLPRPARFTLNELGLEVTV